ncbi:MAG: GNAT family N-acetyltransferase [Anaerolineae bacterium]
MSVEIRQAASEDADAIAALLREAFAEFESLYTPEGFAATAISSEEVVGRIAEGPVWVGSDEERVVGTASAVTREDGLYVRGMAVVPSMQGRGVGRRLLDQVEAFAREVGAQRMYLSSTPFLSSAIRLYERYGFLRTEEGPDDLHGTPLFTMEKPLWS